MTTPPSKPRLLIFVIAYYAESTLRRVLECLPASVFEDYDCEVLVVDDASQDRTFLIGREYKESNPHIRMTVLRNEYNQGYGGNQKVGYAYALAEKFDYVAMVHGDGQYAPEELPRLVAPLREGRADAVSGSRMMTRFGALKGGMPLYNVVTEKPLRKHPAHGGSSAQPRAAAEGGSSRASKVQPVHALRDHCPVHHPGHRNFPLVQITGPLGAC